MFHFTQLPVLNGIGRLKACLIVSAIFGVSAALAAPPGVLPFGAYDPGGDFTSDPELTIEHIFLPWEDVALDTLRQADVYALERNRALIITIEPWTWTRDERNTPDFLRRGIEEGYYDANMRTICATIGTLGSPVSIRWAQEMETDDGQFIWSDWKPEDYINAYKRMIDICRAEAPRINVIWSPIGLENAKDYYPGDGYVDLVGISVFGYEPWDQKVLGKIRSYKEILTERYNNVKDLGKPVLVAELGYSGTAEYVDAWEAEVRQPRPDLSQLVGVVYFDQQEPYEWPDNVGFPDWRLANRVLK